MRIRWYKDGKFTSVENIINNSPKMVMIKWETSDGIDDYYIVEEFIDEYTAILYDNYTHKVHGNPITEYAKIMTKEEVEQFIDDNLKVCVFLNHSNVNHNNIDYKHYYLNELNIQLNN